MSSADLSPNEKSPLGRHSNREAALKRPLSLLGDYPVAREDLLAPQRHAETVFCGVRQWMIFTPFAANRLPQERAAASIKLSAMV
jgi:hypothetical protein